MDNKPDILGLLNRLAAHFMDTGDEQREAECEQAIHSLQSQPEPDGCIVPSAWVEALRTADGGTGLELVEQLQMGSVAVTPVQSQEAEPVCSHCNSFPHSDNCLWVEANSEAARLNGFSAPQPSQEAEPVGEQLLAAQRANERDRTRVCDAVDTLESVIRSREWITEGRGSYEWGDDRWHQEIATYLVDIRTALQPLKEVQRDLAHCPTDSKEVVLARTQPPKAQIPDKWLIWSNEHASWWMPNSRGYTNSLKEAGRYNKEVARKICEDAGSMRFRGGFIPCEIYVASPELEAALLGATQGKESELLLEAMTCLKTVRTMIDGDPSALAASLIATIDHTLWGKPKPPTEGA